MRKKVLTLIGSVCLILILAALPFMGACAPPTPPPEEEAPPPEEVAPPEKPEPEHWTIAMAYDPTGTPDPYAIYHGGAIPGLQRMVYERLISWESITDPDGTIRFVECPQLATSWEYVDPLHARFYLREGVKFQSGEDFTAEAVKTSFDCIKNYTKHGLSKYFSEIDECRIIDPYTVEFILSKPDARLLEYLAWLLIVPASRGTDSEAPAAEAFRENPVGTGPYKIIQWEKDKPVELEAWDGYRDGVMRPKYLTIKYIKDPTTRFASLLAGEVDFVEDPSPTHLPLIEASPDLDVAAIKGGTIILYMMQFLKPPFNNVKVRQAINYAIDRYAIVDQILEGRGTVVPSFPYGPWEGAVPDIEPYPYDPEKAKQLLADAGYTDGFECELETTSGQFMKDVEIAETIQAYLAEVGITVRLKVSEMTTMYQHYYVGDFDIQLSYWTASSITPDQTLKWFLVWGFPEDTISNGVVPEDIAEMRALIDKAGGESDSAKRIAMYEQLCRMVKDYAPLLLIHAQDKCTAYNKAKIGPWERCVNGFYGDYVWWCDYRGMYPAK